MKQHIAAIIREYNTPTVTVEVANTDRYDSEQSRSARLWMVVLSGERGTMETGLKMTCIASWPIAISRPD
ncbi:hypothetical protein [Enterobacter kobei]|uniref:hypothetical protein n=1 Tax=Enterobacter kobei TaxID=208224 RepID=UPI00388FD0EA